MKKSAGEPVHGKSFFDNYKALSLATAAKKIANFIAGLCRKKNPQPEPIAPAPGIHRKKTETVYHWELKTLPPHLFLRILQTKNLDLLIISGYPKITAEWDHLSELLAIAFDSIVVEMCELHNTPAWGQYLTGLSAIEKHEVFYAILRFYESEATRQEMSKPFYQVTEEEMNNFRSNLKKK